ncbi:transient receptor potential cation channel protein painless-like [Lasioglossum baleicum]|uniref:transient receptor potential cation channel protein painless-like n=1 Tax=Lasioglossum baleicum TaxID=434251 RepID=UPI003FCE3E4B
MEPEDECLQMHLLTEYRLSPTKSSLVNAQLLGYLRSKSTKNFKSLIEQLPKSGIDVNRVFPNPGSQETCLDIACKEGLHEFVQILLQNGANVNRINEEENRAAIHYATEKGHEHVLQVLLEDPQINPNLRAGGQTALHIAVTTKNLRCAKLLLEKGANPYVPNNKGLTALHVAAMKKQRPMAELILEKSTRPPDLDSYKDYNEKTTRDVLERNMPELLLPKHTDRQLDVNDLIYHLKANDEASFLDCLRTMPKSATIEIENLIVEAVQQNFKNAISELLERRTTRCNLEKAAVIAIQKGSPHILRRIMDNFDDAGPDAAKRLLLAACIELGIPGGTFKESVSNRLECLRLILDMEDMDVNCADEKGNTPLHHAARADSREAVMMLLEKGSYIGQRNKYGMPAVADIPASTLSQYFDDCIQARKGERKGYQIELDYKCLIPRNNNQRNREMDVFQSIAGNSGLKELLKHPLLSSFIDLKWQRISLVLNASFFFHLLLYVILCVYVISKINIDNSSPTDQPASERTSNIMFSALAGMFLVFALWKLFQLILSPCCYLSNIKNWCEMGLAILGFSMLFGDVHNSIAAVVILSFAWLLVIKMGHYSTLSMDIEMFITVFKKFLRFLFVYITLIFSFAVVFFVLFKNQENFLDLGQSMFKTIIMLTGEFDMGSISFDEHPVTNRLVFVLFVFMITIVLFNLLNGLAVNDTAEIVGKAELVGLIYKIRMISDVESLALNTPYDHSPNCWLFNTSLCFWRARPIPYLADKVLLPKECLKEHKHTIDPNIPKMDSGIVKRAREILSRRDQESGTERIIGELEKLKDMLSSLKLGLDNNNVNVRRDS